MHPILILLLLFIIFWVLKTWGFPMRMSSTGFKYVYVEFDGTVREVDSEEQQYLLEEYHPNDGNRPYIKSNYWSRTPDQKIHGYLKRIRVPWWINIITDTSLSLTAFDITKYCNKWYFNNEQDHQTYPTSDVACPNCQTKTSVNFKDLEKHQHSNFSNLKTDDQNEIAELAKRIPGLPNSFLDYYCPNCQTATRIYYESWGGGKHGEHGFLLQNILTVKGE